MSIPEVRLIGQLLADIDRLDGHPITTTSARGVARRKSSAGSELTASYVCPLHREGGVYAAESVHQQTGLLAERELSQVAVSAPSYFSSSVPSNAATGKKGGGLAERSSGRKRQLVKVAEASDNEEEEEEDNEYEAKKKPRLVKASSRKR